MSCVTALMSAAKAAQSIRPQRVDAYVDKLQFWLPKRLQLSDRPEWLQQALRTRRAHLHNAPMRFLHDSYVQRWQLRQPKPKELQWLAKLDGTLLNAVEVSLDWLFQTYYDRDEAFEVLTRHHVIAGQRGEQQLRWVKGRTRYSAEQAAANVLVMYADKKSRISRDPYCVHLDWRINGTAALQRAGVNAIRDLIGFDHQQFWRERLTLHEIDFARLGRLYHQHFMGRGRRQPWISKSHGITYDHDKRMGYLIYRLDGRGQAQMVVDKFRGKLGVSQCLRGIEVPKLLLPKWPVQIGSETGDYLPGDGTGQQAIGAEQ